MTENSPNIYQRINAIMKEVSYIQKGAKKQGMQYTFVSHDSVTAALRGPMAEHGVVYHPVHISSIVNGNRVELSLTVRFVNVDNPVDYFDVPSFGFGIDTQDKGPGKAMSYAVKYALLKTFGLETGDDPENDSIGFVPAPTIQQDVEKVLEERFPLKKKPWVKE